MGRAFPAGTFPTAPQPRQALGQAQDAGAYLIALVIVKNKAQYEDRNPSVPETMRALRAMESLIRIARAT
ncbi:MAG: hypothetical protein J4G11_08050 [Acidimicrobiia bacterium]|nr:hypothetical protein [Acidimicrobiia bacterium]